VSAASDVVRRENALLAALPQDDLDRLGPVLETVPLRGQTVLHRQHEPITHVYFPVRGIVSETAVMADGAAVELITVGSEGIVGVEAFFGTHPIAAGEATAQVNDARSEARRMRIDHFRYELSRGGALRDLAGRYAQAKLAAVFQVAACNALHSLPQRCARWLLMTEERVGRDHFRLNHQFLAMMLGANRQSVTKIAGALQRAGAIRYGRGHVTVLDRTYLRGSSCECYDAIRATFDQLHLFTRNVAQTTD
jgi:CRP-like cAMP-binding protein